MKTQAQRSRRLCHTAPGEGAPEDDKAMAKAHTEIHAFSCAKEGLVG